MKQTITNMIDMLSEKARFVARLSRFMSCFIDWQHMEGRYETEE